MMVLRAPPAVTPPPVFRPDWETLSKLALMSFKYDWNKEIICQFYAILYFDADA
jgi:hypothetical protein